MSVELESQAPERLRQGARPPLFTFDIRDDKAASSRTLGKRPQSVFIEALELEVEGIAEQSAEESLPFLAQANGVDGDPDCLRCGDGFAGGVDAGVIESVAQQDQRTTSSWTDLVETVESFDDTVEQRSTALRFEPGKRLG
jgi:hypothetical protein